MLDSITALMDSRCPFAGFPGFCLLFSFSPWRRALSPSLLPQLQVCMLIAGSPLKKNYSLWAASRSLVTGPCSWRSRCLCSAPFVALVVNLLLRRSRSPMVALLFWGWASWNLFPRQPLSILAVCFFAVLVSALSALCYLSLSAPPLLRSQRGLPCVVFSIYLHCRSLRSCLTAPLSRRFCLWSFADWGNSTSSVRMHLLFVWVFWPFKRFFFDVGINRQLAPELIYGDQECLIRSSVLVSWRSLLCFCPSPRTRVSIIGFVLPMENGYLASYSDGCASLVCLQS